MMGSQDVVFWSLLCRMKGVGDFDEYRISIERGVLLCTRLRLKCDGRRQRRQILSFVVLQSAHQLCTIRSGWGCWGDWFVNCRLG